MSEQPSSPRKKRTLTAAEPPQRQMQPWLVPDFDVGDVYALQAVYQGRADETQQRKAMDFILKEICGVNLDPFVPGPDGHRHTDYALGKQSAGRIIVALCAARINPRGEQG